MEGWMVACKWVICDGYKAPFNGKSSHFIMKEKIPTNRRVRPIEGVDRQSLASERIAVLTDLKEFKFFIFLILLLQY